MNTITLFIDVVAVCPEPKEFLNNFLEEENHFLQQHRKRTIRRRFSNTPRT